VFDLTYLRSIPNMMVLAPADEVELADALHTALAASGPVAIRYPRGSGEGVLAREPQLWEIGRAQMRSAGSDVALLAVGRMVGVAERAAQLLEEDGISSTVVNARWVKPLDVDAVSSAASSHRLTVTIEENTGVGGFGAAVCEALADLDLHSPVLRLAIPDCFVTHGAMPTLLAEVGLTAEAVRGAVLGRLLDLPPHTTHPEVTGAMPEATADDAASDRRAAR
jgi:1-deoxy-D-xylulose-5-phosphate synthase